MTKDSIYPLSKQWIKPKPFTPWSNYTLSGDGTSWLSNLDDDSVVCISKGLHQWMNANLASAIIPLKISALILAYCKIMRRCFTLNTQYMVLMMSKSHNILHRSPLPAQHPRPSTEAGIWRAIKMLQNIRKYSVVIQLGHIYWIHLMPHKFKHDWFFDWILQTVHHSFTNQIMSAWNMQLRGFQWLFIFRATHWYHIIFIGRWELTIRQRCCLGPNYVTYCWTYNQSNALLCSIKSHDQ